MEPLGIDPPAIDFYAGAIALFAIVLFTKFLTHHVRHVREPFEPKPYLNGWYWAHWACVAAAWLGLFASFVILAEGWSSKTFEKGSRIFVGVMALISGTLLAWDVAVTGRNPLAERKGGSASASGQKGQKPCAHEEPKSGGS